MQRRVITGIGMEYEMDPGALGEEEGYGQEYDEDWDDEDDDYDDEQEGMYQGYDDEGYEDAGTINITVTFSVEDEMQKKREEFCRQEHLVAARYLTLEGNFLYAQAIKDHFSVPCTLPEETTKREIRLDEILRKIARYDADLSIRIWDWCIDHFLPYKSMIILRRMNWAKMYYLNCTNFQRFYRKAGLLSERAPRLCQETYGYRRRTTVWHAGSD